MTNLAHVIRAELFKAAHKRRVYIIAGLSWIVLPVLLVLVGWIIKSNIAGSFLDEGETIQATVQAIASPGGISRIALLLSGVGVPVSFLMVTVVLAATLLFGEEHTQNMWKTVLVTEPSRVTVLTGKLITAMILLAALFVGVYLSGPIIGGLGSLFLGTSFGSGWVELAGLYALQWLFSLVALLFAFLIIWWIRNLPLAVVTVFFLPNLIEGIYSFYSLAVGFKPVNRINVFIQALQLRSTFEDLPRYFFTNNYYSPSREVISSLGANIGSLFGQGGGELEAGLTSFFFIAPPHATLTMAVYALIFGGLLYWSFTRRDIQ